jgi:hypothetical protein
MSLRRSAIVLSFFGASLVVACGFTNAGALDDLPEAGASGAAADSGAAMGAEASAATDGSVTQDDAMTVPVCAPPSCALPAPAAGWELVLLGPSLADACPAGFDEAAAIESPVAGANACACAACVTTGTNCATGGIPTSFDNGSGACGTSGAQHQTNGGLCRAQSGQFGQNARVDAPTAVLGTCTSVASPVPANVVSKPRRVCTRTTSTCAVAACGAPASLKACVAAPGDVACPADAPTKHLVGAGFSLACPSCGCAITAATCGGKLGFYPSADCGGTPVVLNVGVCTATGSASFVSTKWTPAVPSEVCATTPAAPTTTLTTPQTICCP